MSNTDKNPVSLPQLVIGADDHSRLMTMANGLSGHLAELADRLLTELDRAHVVAQHQVPNNVIRMGSTAAFTTSDGTDQTFQLVYPDEADVSAGKISVLTPIGAALIGLAEGQSIPWEARDGRELSLTVVKVEQKAQA